MPNRSSNPTSRRGEYTGLHTFYVPYSSMEFNAVLDFSGELITEAGPTFEANLTFSGSLGFGEGPVESCPPGSLPVIVPILVLKEEPAERLEA